MEYGMFTEKGNIVIHGLVLAAKSVNLSPGQVYSALNDLAKDTEYAEATDTAVREAVYCAIFE